MERRTGPLRPEGGHVTEITTETETAEVTLDKRIVVNEQTGRTPWR